MNRHPEMLTIGVIRVITTDDRPFLETHARMIAEYLRIARIFSVSEARFITDCIEGFPEGIPNREEEVRAVPFVEKTGLRLIQENHADALIVSCAADPGVEELKAKTSVPVIGAGSAGAYFARMLGSRVGVLGIDEAPPQVVQNLLGSTLAGYVRPSGVRTTLDIQSNIDDYIDRTKTLIDTKGADVLLLACTGLSTAGIAAILEEALNGIPVIDSVIAAGISAYYAARGIRLRKQEA
jgi:allantoin racemase